MFNIQDTSFNVHYPNRRGYRNPHNPDRHLNDTYPLETCQ